MNKPTEIEQLATTTEKDYSKKLRENNNKIYAVNLASDLHKKIDNIIRHVKDKGVKFACESGCSYCCSLEVYALEPEIFYIARKLKEAQNKQQIDALINTLATYLQKSTNLLATDSRTPCPMLDDGRCSIYEIRPSKCRELNVLNSSEGCKTFFAKVDVNREVMVKSEVIRNAFRASYHRKKLPASLQPFIRSLHIALTDDTAEKRWYDGEQVFDSK